MRNTLAFLAALALTVAAAGWYLGWYHIQAMPGHAGHESVNIDIDTGKAGQDLHKGEQKVEKLLEKKGLTGPAADVAGPKDKSAPLIQPPRGLFEESEPKSR
jgi:hypothetical protein